MAAFGSRVGIGGTLTSPAPILVRVAVLVLAVPARREEVPRAEPAEGELADPLDRPSRPVPHSSRSSRWRPRSAGRSPSTSPSVGGAVPTPPVVAVPAVLAYNFFVRRLKVQSAQLGQLASALLAAVSRQERPAGVGIVEVERPLRQRGASV